MPKKVNESLIERSFDAMNLRVFGDSKGGSKIWFNKSLTEVRKEIASELKISVSYLRKLVPESSITQISHWKKVKNGEIINPKYKYDIKDKMQVLLKVNRHKKKIAQEKRLSRYSDELKNHINLGIKNRGKISLKIIHTIIIAKQRMKDMKENETIKISKTSSMYYKLKKLINSKKHKDLYLHFPNIWPTNISSYDKKRLNAKKYRHTPISERSVEVNKPFQPGHIEIDTIHCRKNRKNYSAIIFDRFTKKSHTYSIENLSTNSMITFLRFIQQKLNYPILTITCDNGPENSKLHLALKNVKIYSCNPYSPHEKGMVESRIRIYRKHLEDYPQMNKIVTKEWENLNQKINLEIMLNNSELSYEEINCLQNNLILFEE